STIQRSATLLPGPVFCERAHSIRTRVDSKSSYTSPWSGARSTIGSLEPRQARLTGTALTRRRDGTRSRPVFASCELGWWRYALAFGVPRGAAARLGAFCLSSAGESPGASRTAPEAGPVGCFPGIEPPCEPKGTPGAAAAWDHLEDDERLYIAAVGQLCRGGFL